MYYIVKYCPCPPLQGEGGVGLLEICWMQICVLYGGVGWGWGCYHILIVIEGRALKSYPDLKRPLW